MVSSSSGYHKRALPRREFVPAIMDVIAIDTALSEVSDAQAQLAAGARSSVQEELLYGIPREQLEAAMLNVFVRADKDGSGTLDKQARYVSLLCPCSCVAQCACAAAASLHQTVAPERMHGKVNI